MNLQPVQSRMDGKIIYLQCKHCGTMGPIGIMLADLDGEPFKAYYHQECAKKAQK